MTSLPEPYITAPDEACIPCLGDDCPDADKCPMKIEDDNLCKCGAVIFNDAETCLACAIDNMKGE
jgi:hypothetical protein